MMTFLSTLSLRRATWHLCFCIPCQCNFYPRSPCGERRAIPCYRHDVQNISIHALLAESDMIGVVILCLLLLFLSTLSLRRATSSTDMRSHNRQKFLSTLSLRRATVNPYKLTMIFGISIHALLAESDWRFYAFPLFSFYFYPRSPCGERHFSGTAWVQEFPISIHALLAESDKQHCNNLPI